MSNPKLSGDKKAKTAEPRYLSDHLEQSEKPITEVDTSPAVKTPPVAASERSLSRSFRDRKNKISPILPREKSEFIPKVPDLKPEPVEHKKVAIARWHQVKRAMAAAKGFNSMGRWRQRARIDTEKKEAMSKQHYELVNVFNVRKMSERNVAQKKKKEVQQSINWYDRYVLVPEMKIIRFWYLTMGTIICFQVIYIPFIVSFSPDITGTTWYVVDSVFDAFFWVDIMLHFNMAYYTSPPSDSRFSLDAAAELKTKMVVTRKKIAAKYLKGWFWIDFIAAIPYDKITSNETEALGLFKGFRLPRLLGLLRLLRVLKILRVRSKLVHWIKYSTFSNIIRLIRLLVTIFAIVHLMSCLWFIIAADRWAHKWYAEDDSLMHKYARSFYSSLLMMMGEEIGPVTVVELFYCSFAIIMGAVIIAVIFGNVAMLVSNFYADSTLYHKKMKRVFISMKHLGLPKELQERVQLYYSYLWQQYHSLDGDTSQFIPELSSNLQMEVSLYLNAKMIRNTPMLQECSTEVVQDLVLQLETRIFMPNDNIVVHGEIGLEMYFIQRGVCQVFFVRKIREGIDAVPEFREEPSSLGPMHAGDYFGEIALILDTRRTATVRAMTFCTICCLHRSHFDKILSGRDEDRSIMEEKILNQNRYKEGRSPQFVAVTQEEKNMKAGRTRPRNGRADDDVIRTLCTLTKTVENMSKRLEKMENTMMNNMSEPKPSVCKISSLSIEPIKPIQPTTADRARGPIARHTEHLHSATGLVPTSIPVKSKTDSGAIKKHTPSGATPATIAEEKVEKDV